MTEEPDRPRLTRSPGWRFPRPSPGDELPGRIRAIVSREDRASERLIGWVQLGAGLLWAVLYALAPRPSDASGMFAPVPTILAAYILFSLLRVWLIAMRRTPDWFVALSISIDVGLLLVLIWLFHIEYRQPAGFSLKVPAFLYLFLFIVLRSLRFDPRYVMAAGLAAVTGWTVLVGAAVRADGGQAITHSFSQYMATSRILIGAEVEKIVVLAAVTAILALSALRAQRTLITAVREEAATREISRFLSHGVADQIARSEIAIEAGQVTERDAAILMLDIRGFTAFAGSRSPREVVTLLTSLHRRVVPVVRRHGGVIDKFLGDGVMATFGAIAPSERAAAAALAALDEILLEADAWEASLAGDGAAAHLKVNAAVADGRVVFATLGDANRLEYTVIGEAVNLAAKLEKHNKTAGTRALVAAETLVRAIAQGYRPPGSPQSLRGARVAGLAHPIDLCVPASQGEGRVAFDSAPL